MLPSLDPKKMQAIMKQMGIKQEEIDAVKVTIEQSSGKKIIFDNPSVMRVNMQGQDSWQISGDYQEVQGTGFSDEDIETIMEKTSSSKEDAIQALQETRDIAEAIIKLS